MTSPDAIDSPIFITGSGRSGTTLLRMMLNAHPAIHVSNDAAYYLHALRAKTSGEWLRSYQRTVSFAWMKFSPKQVERHVPRDLSRHAPCKAIDALMRLKASQYGKTRHGDKMPGYGWRLGRILADFPDARIIHVVRDPIATVTSLKRMPWAPRSIVLNSLMLAGHQARMETHRDRILEIRLEDLLESPEPVMRRSLEFVGVEWNARVLSHEEFAPFDDMPPFPWFTTARQKRSRAALMPAPRFPTLTGTEKALVEYFNRGTIRRFGYGRSACAPTARLAAVLYVLRDVPRLCLDLFGMGRAWLALRRASCFRQMSWPDDGAWKYYPGFNPQDVMDWEADRPRD